MKTLLKLDLFQWFFVIVITVSFLLMQNQFVWIKEIPKEFILPLSDIFNFGMEKVYSEIYNLNSYYGALKWDGRDMAGNHVANGVYFIRLNFSSSRNQSPGDNWTKLIVVK